MVVNKDHFLKSRLGVYVTLLHEIIHHYSFGSLIALDSIKDIKIHRSGYRANNTLEEINHEHFRGLNEAIIENLTMEIIKNSRDFF